MANTFVKIGSITVGAGGTTGMDFTSIPSTYTDLAIFVSARTSYSAIAQYITLYFNDDGSGYTAKNLVGTGSTTLGSSNSEITAGSVSATSTSDTFSSVYIYIPNYAGSQYKSYAADAVTENNASTAYQSLTNGLWSNTAAITKVAISGAGQTFVQYSTATLYGIKNS